MTKTKYAFAGASLRALEMYGKPITNHFAQSAQVVGVFDINPIRAQRVGEACNNAPAFTDFDEMLRATQPDVVIVTTVDRYHHEYIIRSLRAGCDAITEKPMTIDDEKCRAILAAEQETGRAVTVTFNYRFQPYVTKAKELLRSGVIGPVYHVDFEWLLDRSHGADYFRRWHRRKENSGGLLVHKSTHHFDLVNWLLDSEPERVFALGSRRFYGPTRQERGERCSTCAYTQSCEFYVDLASRPGLNAHYFQAEQHDGYFRDRCVFSEEIDIEDTMNVLVRYTNGAQMSYSLTAYSPYEGWYMVITGKDGRMELREIESGPESGGDTLEIRIFDKKGQLTKIDVPVGRGGHGGGDSVLLQRLFSGEDLPDPLNHMAGSRAGAMSILTGIAANHAIASGQAVTVADLLKG
ncbi:MAG: Gfo/Idh/MocA family oxidoreductase [Caldilineaceae bacterium]